MPVAQQALQVKTFLSINSSTLIEIINTSSPQPYKGNRTNLVLLTLS